MEETDFNFTSTSTTNTSFLTPPSSPLSFEDASAVVVFNVPGEVANADESIDDFVFRACEEREVAKKQKQQQQRFKKARPAVFVKRRPPFGLSEITDFVLKKIRNVQPISWLDLKADIYAQYSSNAMRRRIYDAVNILVGSGLLVRFRSDEKVTMLATTAYLDQLVKAGKQEQIRVLTQELVRRTSLLITTPERGGETDGGEPNLMIETNDDNSIVVFSCCQPFTIF